MTARRMHSAPDFQSTGNHVAHSHFDGDASAYEDGDVLSVPAVATAAAAVRVQPLEGRKRKSTKPAVVRPSGSGWSTPLPAVGFPLGWMHMVRTNVAKGKVRTTPKWNSPDGLSFRSRVAALRFIDELEDGGGTPSVSVSRAAVEREQRKRRESRDRYPSRRREQRKRGVRGTPRNGRAACERAGGRGVYDRAAAPWTVAPRQSSEEDSAVSEDDSLPWRKRKRRAFDTENAALFVAIAPQHSGVLLRGVPGAVEQRVVRRRGRPLYI